MEFKEGDPVVYRNGDSFGLGVVKRKMRDGVWAVWYSGGDTAAATPEGSLAPLSDQAMECLARHAAMGGNDSRSGCVGRHGREAHGGESVVGLLTDVDRAFSEFEGTDGSGDPSAFTCGYFGNSYRGTQCVDCPHSHGEGCSVEMMKDIRRRLHALMPNDADGAEMRLWDVIDDGYEHTVAGFLVIPTTVGGWVITTEPCECRVVHPDSWERLTEEAIEAGPAATDLIARAKRLAGAAV